MTTADCQRGEGEAEQRPLFENPPWWSEHWADMPEFNQENAEPYDKVTVLFKTKPHRDEFLEKMGYPPIRSRPIWYPRPDGDARGAFTTQAVSSGENAFPVYVISKGRANAQDTARALNELGINYMVIVEPQEFDQYAASGVCREIRKLPFSNLGQGSIPARNWVYEDAVKRGYSHHWILDDNIRGWYRLTDNKRSKIREFNPFYFMEQFALRYKNIGLLGPHSITFADNLRTTTPFIVNTRIYSCILINHATRHRWRGRYNEDTDLSLRILKDGWATVLFNALLMDKRPTMTVAGGNTDELYQAGGRKEMAESLERQHPDIVKTTWKWGRVQHHVDYSGFKQKLIFKDGRTDEEIERIRREHSKDGPAWMPAMAEADWKAEEALEQRQDESA